MIVLLMSVTAMVLVLLLFWPVSRSARGPGYRLERGSTKISAGSYSQHETCGLSKAWHLR